MNIIAYHSWPSTLDKPQSCQKTKKGPTYKMKSLFKNTIVLAYAILSSCCVVAQSMPKPKISISAAPSSLSINVRSTMDTNIPIATTTTNFNPSVQLNSTSLAVSFDSLHTDRYATVVTVYETEDDSPVGLWQISNSGMPCLWLNSQRASYEDYSIQYRKCNEKGVVVHTMTYAYPGLNRLYDGHDTLQIGICDTLMGSKNFCALQYFDTKISAREQRILESALAIRYGAWLHGPYFDSRMDTLWDTRGADSSFSHGICGIGRDDSLCLMQPRSKIRKDILEISAAIPLRNLSHVMMGCDDGDTVFVPIPVMVGGSLFLESERQWKVRGHGNDVNSVFFSTAQPYLGCKLMIETGGVVRVVDIGDTVHIVSGMDMLVRLLVPAESIPSQKKQYDSTPVLPRGVSSSQESIVMVSPNPTSGNYTLHFSQTDEDYVDIRVVDVRGRTIETHKTSDRVNEYRHDSSLTASGIYYVTVSSNGTQQTVKLVVVK